MSNRIDIKKSLKKAYRKLRPTREEIELLRQELIQMLDESNPKESEEYHKGLIKDFLKKHAYSEHFINTKDRSDLVIHNGKKPSSNVGVIIEAKKPSNKAEMPTIDNLNKKATQELLLYFLRERIAKKNIDIKHLIATNLYEWFIFNAKEFDKIAENTDLRKHFKEFEEGRLSFDKTEYFYKEIAAPVLEQVKNKIEFVYFDIRDYEKHLQKQTKAGDRKLIELQKILSPTHLLKLPFTNDSNTLNRNFYSELLHIIGLEEYKDKGKKLIRQKTPENRDEDSLIEAAIAQIISFDKLSRIENVERFGDNADEQLFNVGLELVITWINRILFLKLLESQVVSYHNSKDYIFLNKDKVPEYDDLDTLFFKVLAIERKDRPQSIKEKFPNVPYLNSSLFEPTDLEHQTIFVGNLPDNTSLPLYKKSILKNGGEKLNTLEYLLKFLDAYDFSSEGTEDVAEENKTLINASVLGLIFEKINGYKDGSYFTPGFITMYMCKETIRRAVVQKFKEQTDFDSDNFYDLVNYTSDTYKKDELRKYNEIINSLKICDPAVGSGHFLVSSLNEIIAIKSELGILIDDSGKKLSDYLIDVENDELMILDRNGDFFKYEPTNRDSQVGQKTLFHEKQSIIENCLFGVDINQNSVKICRLRLWIELLKNAYYKKDGELETLPNIDINIKCGNSLISRYPLDSNLNFALVGSTWDITSYRHAVMGYRNAKNKEQKQKFNGIIEKIKEDFHIGITEKDPIWIKRENLLKELNDLISQGRLFEQDNFKKDKKVIQRVEKLSIDIKKLEEQIEKIKSGAIYTDAFEWRFEFPEVLDEKTGDFKGFDIVLANPPYKVMLKGTLENYKYAKKNNNIYSAFVELGISLLAEKSRMQYIIPTTWLAGNNFYAMRDRVLSEKLINLIVQLPYDVFDEPYVDSLIVGLSSLKSNIVKTFKFNIREKVSREHDYINFDPNIWEDYKDKRIFLDPNLITILDKYKNTMSLKIKDIAEVQRGTLPPKQNETFKTKSPQRLPWFNHQVHRYKISYESDELFVVPENLREGKPKSLFLSEKILGRQLISRQFRLQFTYCIKPFAFKKNLYAIYNLDKSKCAYYYLLAILNSKFYSFVQIGFNASGQRDDYPSFSLQDYRNFLIPKISKSQQQLFIKLVNEILKIKEKNPNADTRELEDKIDQMVYRLYGLTDDEIKIVEESTK